MDQYTVQRGPYHQSLSIILALSAIFCFAGVAAGRTATTDRVQATSGSAHLPAQAPVRWTAKVSQADYQFSTRDSSFANIFSNFSNVSASNKEPQNTAQMARRTSNQCSLVSVYAITHHGQDLFAKLGVSWVIAQGKVGLRVITPAHVTVGTDSIYIVCGATAFAMQLNRTSASLDLSLLDFKVPQLFSGKGFGQEHLFPVFWLDHDPALLNEELQAARLAQPSTDLPPGNFSSQILYPTRAKETELNAIRGATLGGMGGARVVARHPSLFGSSEAIVFMNSDVMPGMSGSLVVSTPSDLQKNETQVIGMVLKAENNGSETIVLPTASIIEFIRGFGYVNGRDYFENAGVYFEYVIDFKNGRALQSTRLVVEDQSTKAKHYFTEACTTGYPETADWIQVSRPSDLPKSVAWLLSSEDSHAHRKSFLNERRTESQHGQSQVYDIYAARPGDHGDGSGGLKSASSPFEYFIFKYGNSDIGVLQTRLRGCQARGIVTPWGETISSFVVGGAIERVDALGAFARRALDIEFARLRNPEMSGAERFQFLRDTLARITIHDSPGAGWATGLICLHERIFPDQERSVVWPPDYSIKAELGDDRAHSPVRRVRKSYAQIGGLGLIHGQISCAPTPEPIDSSPAREHPYRISDVIFESAPQRSTDPLKRFLIKVSSNRQVTGEIEIGDQGQCIIPLNDKTLQSASLWTHAFKTEQVEGQLSLSSAYPFFELSFTKISPECSKKDSPGFFLLEHVWDETVRW